MWKNIDKARQDSAHYSVMNLENPSSGMAALKEMFPDGKVDELNFVLFSTSGVHGTYNMIEEAEAFLNGDEEQIAEVTFLVIHPRLVALRYGTCNPINKDDIDFLKKLRANSHKQMTLVGMP
jgi:hypothetical protein